MTTDIADIADIIAGELKVSRSTAYDLMREALKEASPLQEPVATVQSLHVDGKDIGVQAHLHQHLPVGTKLYAAPPAAPVQEPVAWCVLEPWLSGKFEAQDCFSDVALDANVGWVPLYTTPPEVQRKPLTDEQQIAEALRQHGLTLVKTSNGYAVLRLGQIDAHGITGETK